MKLIINSSPTNIQEWFHLRDQHIRFQRSKRARSFQLETGPKEDRPHGIAMHSNGNIPPLVIDFQFESSRMGKKGRVIDGTSSCSLFFFFVCQFENSFKLGNSRSNSFHRFNSSTINPRVVTSYRKKSRINWRTFT